MTDYLQVVTTLPSEAAARELATALVADRLAACVQIEGPVTSLYRWQGEVATATEWRLTMKLPAAGYAALESAIQQRHPYEIPEILAVPVTAGLPAYLKWVDSSCKAPQTRTDDD